MARTVILIDIDDVLYREVETAARRMDISPETYMSVAAEQHVNRQLREKRAAGPFADEGSAEQAPTEKRNEPAKSPSAVPAESTNADLTAAGDS